MAVLIKGLNKPHSCGDCWWIEHCDRWRNRNWGAAPPSDCPVGQVPPHGALMDRDEFFATCPELVDGYKRITDDLVVIPAEGGQK